ncbi:hypothetical protein NECAME_19254, partial [Necator americanus]
MLASLMKRMSTTRQTVKEARGKHLLFQETQQLEMLRVAADHTDVFVIQTSQGKMRSSLYIGEIVMRRILN